MRTALSQAINANILENRFLACMYAVGNGTSQIQILIPLNIYLCNLYPIPGKEGKQSDQIQPQNGSERSRKCWYLSPICKGQTLYTDVFPVMPIKQVNTVVSLLIH